MAREEQHLMCRAQISDSQQRRATPAEIKIHEDVVKDNREWIDVVRVFANQRQAHR